jgi:UDP-galactopyranose mutase
MASQEQRTTFVGRLGTYRYLDMHITIAEAFDVVQQYLACVAKGEVMPAFIVDPLA